MTFIQMRGITKRFDPVIANDQIDLDIGEREILALLGENGAGKSTLMKILYGVYHPDAGDIFIGGQSVRLKSPADAIRLGIGFVSQHFSLVPSFTVAENIVLGRENRQILDQTAMRDQVSALAARYGFNIDPDARVRDLSVGQQQRVEILKALYRDCRLLILDEPTAVLTPQDTESLFAALRTLQAGGLSVVIITHKLEEVMAVCNRVVVLRGGKVVGIESTQTTTPERLATLMVGRGTVAIERNTQHSVGEKTVLTVEKLSFTDTAGVPRLRDVSFRVHSGEIVGIAGVAGNGQTELGAILHGMLTPNTGRVLVDDRSLPFGSPNAVHQAGIGRIPEDRLRGIVGELTVADNLVLESLDQFTIGGHLNHALIIETAKRLIDEYQIKARPTDRARTLSGGNIQKIILARALMNQPNVVIAAQPTRGLDVGATEYVHRRLLEQKARGAGVVLISEDLDEIMLLSDRILIMVDGGIAGVVDAVGANREHIGLLMAGGGHAVSA